jgi:RHS repeat-associated protein
LGVGDAQADEVGDEHDDEELAGPAQVAPPPTVRPATCACGASNDGTLGIQLPNDAASRRTSTTAPVTCTVANQYDGAGRRTSLTYPGGHQVTYGYNERGLLTSVSAAWAGSTTYSYDAANRLTAAGSDTYTFDANGNQTSATVGGVTTTYTFDALDRMTAIGGAVTASYASNGLGLRVSATVGGVTTSTAWDLAADPPQQLVEGSIEFVRGLGNELLAAAPLGGAATTVAADALGSPRLVTDASGNVVGSTQYDAFGAVKAQSGTQAQVGFTGEQQDAASGLVYLRARYYDPRTGRFLSTDPVRGSAARPASQHAYAYALQNPQRYGDPKGTLETDVNPEPTRQPILLVLVELKDDVRALRGSGGWQWTQGFEDRVNREFGRFGITVQDVIHWLDGNEWSIKAIDHQSDREGYPRDNTNYYGILSSLIGRFSPYEITNPRYVRITEAGIGTLLLISAGIVRRNQIYNLNNRRETTIIIDRE